MKSLEKLFNFYIFSNIHVAIATTCLVLVSASNIQGPSLSYSPHFVFFSTLVAYQFIRVFENCECSPNAILSYLKKQPKEMQLVGVLALLGTSYFGFLIGVDKFWIILPAIFITFWYAIPLFNYKGKRISLRNYPTLKILSIALVWALLTVIFPLQESVSSSQVWLEFTQRFFLIMALVIPFDIRDLQQDVTHLQTLPQKIGIFNSKMVGILFLALFLALGFFKLPLTKNTFIPELLIFVLSLIFIVKSKEKQSKYYAAFWVESLPIIWYGLLLFTKAAA